MARSAKTDEDRKREAHIALLKRQQAAVLSRDDLMAFTRFTRPDPEAPNDVTRSSYRAQKFHVEIATTLQMFEKGDLRLDDGRPCNQLIFCMPPRHGKTELATKSLAAWYSGRHPEHDIIVAAAGDQLASDFGGDTRSIMQSPAFRQVFPHHKLRRGGTAKDNIQTDKGGRVIYAGAGGQINGRGAHLLLIDDLIKNDQDAASKILRDQQWNWFNRVALNRRMGKKLTIITMTRWHSDDIIGRLTDPQNDVYSAEEAANWKIIRLPGLAEKDDPLGRAEGEALWPEIRDVEDFKSQRRRDPLGFASLIQQRPTAEDGVLFRRENIKRYDLPPTNLRYYAASDHAVATGQKNDFSCFLKVGVDEFDDIYVVECFLEKVPADRAVEQMLVMGAEGERKPLIWWAERGHISKSIGPFLNKRMMETQRYLNVKEITPIGDKQQRAQSIAARVALGKVKFPHTEWAEKVIEQMMAFPNGNHDDAVDALAYIGLGLGSQFKASRPVTETRKEPRFGTLAWVKQADRWAQDKRRQMAAGGI